MSTQNELLKRRRFVGELLKNVLIQKITVLDAVKAFPKDFEDKHLEAAFHALLHLEADEDMRSKDPLYAQEQDDYLEILSQTLSRGEDLPQNIIAEYNNYYPETLLYKPDTKENWIKRLKKFINM